MTFNSKYIFFQKKTLQSRGYFCEGIEKKLINKINKKFNYLIDVGFHKGEISKIFIKKNKKIIVYGFDSNNSLSHKQISELKKKNIFYQEMIVANKNSFSNFHIYNQRPELSSLKKRNDYLPYITKNFTNKKCVTVKLDSFITKKKLNGSLFVKIDAEGSEKLVFYGMKKSLKKCEMSGYFEYGQSWENFKFKLRDVFYLLKDLNYNIYRICNEGLIHMRYFNTIDENFYNSLYFFTKKNLKDYGFKKRLIPSLTSIKKDEIYIY